MKRLAIVFVSLIFSADISFAAQQGPEISVVGDKVTVNANSVPLARLLQLFDSATGMTSRAPAELANRPVSVQFTDLPLNAAVEKIFQGQMLDYVYVGGRGIIVTSMSQAAPIATSPIATSPIASPFPQAGAPFGQAQGAMAEPGFAQDPNNPANLPMVTGAAPGAAGNPFNNQAQPAMIQTPFGPIPNPRLNQENTNVAQPAQPGSIPAGTVVNPFGNPFGSAVPFGIQDRNLPQPTTPPSVFGNPTASSPGTTIAPITTAPLVPNQPPPNK